MASCDYFRGNVVIEFQPPLSAPARLSGMNRDANDRAGHAPKGRPDQFGQFEVWHFCRNRGGARSRTLVFSGWRRGGHDRQEHLRLRHDRLRRNLRIFRPLRQPPARRDHARLRISFNERTARARARRDHTFFRIRRHGGHQELHTQGELAWLDGHPVSNEPGWRTFANYPPREPA